MCIYIYIYIYTHVCRVGPPGFDFLGSGAQKMKSKAKKINKYLLGIYFFRAGVMRARAPQIAKTARLARAHTHDG